MNRKDLNEIRRRLRPDRNSIQHIYGCYVNGAKEIISTVDESVGLLTAEESEQYISLLRKTLSGTLGRNLIDISFASKQVMDSDEHRLLSALRSSGLEDAKLRERFFRCIIDSLDMDGANYLILLASDSYDVPRRAKDGHFLEDSDNVFRYILCCICPVRSGKAALGFVSDESRFRSCAPGQLVSAPELGFMFPSFDERAANIYSAVFYSRSTDEIHQEFIDSVFKTEVPMSPAHQREAFNAALSSLENECRYDILRSVHEQLTERIELHKESREPEPLTVSVAEMADILENGGLSAVAAEGFAERCSEEFGRDAALSPQNLIDTKHFSVCTPQVKISVDPKFSYLVETRIIDGKKYILVPADAGVEVNGVNAVMEA